MNPKEIEDSLTAAELYLAGSIRSVLTWNLTESAFLELDGSRAKYPLLRGGPIFARFVRDVLCPRIADGEFFEPDPINVVELGLSYQAGLVSQYTIDYELNPSFRVKEGTSLPNHLGEILKQDAYEKLSRAWDLWPIKRFRLSRYGFLQVILERPEGKFENSTEFLRGLDDLHTLMPVAGASSIPDGEDRESCDYPGLAVSAKWEIVGQILSWLIDIFCTSESRGDLLRFDRSYRNSWRKKPAYTTGTSLPLRTSFLILLISRLKCGEAEIQQQIPAAQQAMLARLLEEVPFVEDGPNREISPQSDRTLTRILETDEATWAGEVCLLSCGTAVITALHSFEMGLPRGLNYGKYWLILLRTFEYMAELRQLARLVERQSSDLFEDMMEQVKPKRRLGPLEHFAASSAALAGLATRLRVSAAPYTIVQNDAMLPKIEHLRSAFDIGCSLENATQNLSAIQNLLSHAENQQTDKKILFLTAGLAAFTAILMGLAIPPYFHYAQELAEAGSRFGMPSFLTADRMVTGWGWISACLTVAAFLSGFTFLANGFELGRRGRSAARRIRAFFGSAGSRS